MQSIQVNQKAMTVLRQVMEVADSLVATVNQNMDVGEAYLREFDEQF
jgi:hypothetical protein